MADLSNVVARLLRAMRTYGNDRLEFEFRLGHKMPGGAFRPGVDPQSWARLKSALDAGRAWKVTHLQTSERLDGNGVKRVLSQDGAEHLLFKKRLADEDFATDSPWCARASLSLEEREADVQAHQGEFKYERRKDRWSYVYECWSIDMTRVTGNMPHQLDEDTECYEVEIELADTRELFVRTADATVAWGWQLLTDLCRLMASPEG